jgi:flagellar motor switch protein FliN/FliY
MFTTHSPYYDDLKAAYVEREAPREAKGSQGKPREAKGSQGELKTVTTFDKVSVDITVVLGTTTMPIHQVLRLGRGAIIELESSEDDAVHILANNLPVAKGTVVVNGNRIAVEVGDLLPRPLDMR